MKKRNILVGAALLLLFGSGTTTAFAQAPSCSDLIINSCVGCHTKDRICAKLGKSKKSWKGIISFMIANGADLDDEEVEVLSDCMSEPAAEAVATCADVDTGGGAEK